MTALLSGNNPTDRLTEVLAGSTAVLSQPTDIPSSLSLASTSGSDDGAGDVSDLPLSVTGLTQDLPLAPLTEILCDAGGQGGAGLPLLGDSGLPVVGDLLGNKGSDYTLNVAGPDGILQPVLNAVNAEVLDIHFILETLTHQLGIPNLGHGLTGAGETVGLGRIGTTPETHTGSNLITDVLNAPGTLLGDGGLGEVVSQVGGDMTDVVHAINNLGNQVLIGPDTLNPLPELTSWLGSDLQHIPLLTVNGGNNDGNGGLLGGIIGDVDSSPTGHLIDLDVGPEQSNGLVLDLLARPTPGPHHAVEVNAVDEGLDSPHLADLGVLTGGSDGLNIPVLNGAGLDDLTGNLLGEGGLLSTGNLLNDGGLLSAGNILSGNSTSAPVTVPVDVSTMVHDLLPASLIADHGILDTHGTHVL